jgi:hypothetical protein
MSKYGISNYGISVSNDGRRVEYIGNPTSDQTKVLFERFLAGPLDKVEWERLFEWNWRFFRDEYEKTFQSKVDKLAAYQHNRGLEIARLLPDIKPTSSWTWCCEKLIANSICRVENDPEDRHRNVRKVVGRFYDLRDSLFQNPRELQLLMVYIKR